MHSYFKCVYYSDRHIDTSTRSEVFRHTQQRAFVRARALQRWWRHHANTHTHTHTHTQTHTPKQKTHLNKNTFIARNALEHKNPICEVVAIMTTHRCVSDLWRAILECLDLFNKQVYYRLHVFFHELVVLLLIRGSGERPAGWNGKQVDSRL